MPQLPELPPGYEIVHEKAADYGPEVTEDFWGITVRGDWCDGIYEQWPKTRAEAVERAWSMWLDYDADDPWREFIEALDGRDGDSPGQPEKAEHVLRLAGWELRDGRWWRDGVWATARGGVIDIKATIGAAEAMAFATLAGVPEAQDLDRRPAGLGRVGAQELSAAVK